MSLQDALALKKNTALIYRVDGTVGRHVGTRKLDGDDLYALIGCERFQMVPCTASPLSPEFELWMDEEGLYKDGNFNALATTLFGNQVHDGELHGNVVVVRRGTVE